MASRISLDYIFFRKRERKKQREEKEERKTKGGEGKKGEEKNLPIKAGVSIHCAWTACPFNVGKGWTTLVV